MSRVAITYKEAVITGLHRASAHYSDRDTMIGTKVYNVRVYPLSYIERHYGESDWFSVWYRTAEGKPGCIFGGRVEAKTEPEWEV